MAPLRLIFALSSLFLAEAYWACPTAPLGNGLAGKFPNSTDDYYPAGMKCLITIGVPAGQLVTVHYTSYETNNTLLFFDDTGTYFYSSPTATPVNFYIQITGNDSGRFRFTWTYSNINPAAPVGFSTVADDVGLVQNVYTMQKNSSALVKSHSPVTIFGAAASGNSQYILLYGGEGTSGPFLGSLYTLNNVNKSIVYTTAPFTVTVVNVLTNSSSVDGGLLFRTSASIENLDYRFAWQGSSIYLNNVTIAPLHKKAAALTVYNNINTTNYYMYSLKTDGKVDWLPGSNLPPVAPTVSWNSFVYNNNILVPGVMNTFVTNSSASFSFSQLSSSSLNFYVGDVFYFPSQNYRLPSLPQDETASRHLGYDNIDIVVTVINCYGYFQISRPGSVLLTITNGTATISGSAWSKPTGGTDPMYFSYVSTNTSQDTGGLLRIEGVHSAPPTTTPKLKGQLFNLLPAITYIFFKLLS